MISYGRNIIRYNTNMIQYDTNMVQYDQSLHWKEVTCLSRPKSSERVALSHSSTCTYEIIVLLYFCLCLYLYSYIYLYVYLYLYLHSYLYFYLYLYLYLCLHLYLYFYLHLFKYLKIIYIVADYLTVQINNHLNGLGVVVNVDHPDPLVVEVLRLLREDHVGSAVAKLLFVYVEDSSLNLVLEQKFLNYLLVNYV